MEAHDRWLPDWLTRIRTRQVVLPRFQRMEAWGPTEVADLLETVVNELPAGAALVLEVGREPPFPWRPIVGAPEDGERIAEQLLDGQQRLTALWRSLTDSYPDRTYFVALPEPDGTDGKLTIDAPSRWWRDGRLYPLWADDPKKAWQRRRIPVRLMRPDAEAEVSAWAGEVADGDARKELEVFKEINRVRDLFKSFNLPFLALPVGTEPDVALDVFIKMNTRTVRLTAFDIIVARVEGEVGQPLHDLVKSLNGTVPALSSYAEPQDVVLSIAALLQDRTPTVAGWLGLDFRRMIRDWPVIMRGAQLAVAFLEQERVPDQQRFPTMPVLAPLIALWCEVQGGPDALGNAHILLRKYLWRAFLTDRYERAAATAAHQDYRALRRVLQGVGDESAIPIFDEDRHPPPEFELLIQAGWPKKRDRLARALLLLSLRGGALDIADGAEATREQLDRREYHHLFPIKHLSKQEWYEEGIENRALNCALITWKTNRTISAKDPLIYLRERAEASTLGEAEIRYRLATHAVPFDPLTAGNYEGFLDERAHILIDGIRKLFDGRAWSPSLAMEVTGLTQPDNASRSLEPT